MIKKYFIIPYKSRQLQTVKSIADCQDSSRLLRQLHTEADCQDNCRQLQTIADMMVLVCSVRCLLSHVLNGWWQAGFQAKVILKINLPILDTRYAVLCLYVYLSVTLMVPTLDSETVLN